MASSSRSADGDLLTPLARRAVEIDIAHAFFSAAEQRLGRDAAQEMLESVVGQLAVAAAQTFGERYPAPSLRDLWEIWQFLGGDDRLELHLDELSDHKLRFHVDRCAYADLYRERGLEEIGVAFSCRRDEPFAKALIRGIGVQQSKTILEGSNRCEFTYTLEDQ
jgi:hypothetical protein